MNKVILLGGSAFFKRIWIKLF